MLYFIALCLHFFYRETSSLPLPRPLSLPQRDKTILTLLFLRAWRRAFLLLSSIHFVSVFLSVSLYSLISLLHFRFLATFCVSRITPSCMPRHTYCIRCTSTHRKILLAYQNGKSSKMQPDRVKITEFRRRYCGLFKALIPQRTGSTHVINCHRGRTASHSGEPRNTVRSYRAQFGPQGTSIFYTGYNTGDAPREAPSRHFRTCSPKPLVPRQTVARASSLLSWISSAACSTMRKKNGSSKRRDEKARLDDL